MRVFAAGFFTAVWIALASSFSLADSPDFKSLSAPPAKPKLASTIELLEWEARIAENSYANQQTDKRFSALIGVYERIIAQACMPQLMKTLQHAGSPTEPTCLKYIDETLKLDSENPMALCARDGIDSKSCDEAFAAQELGTYSTDTSLWPGEDGSETQLELQLEASKAPTAEISKIEGELYSLQASAQISPEHRSKNEPLIEAAFGKILALACRRPKLKIVSLLGDSNSKPAQEILDLLRDQSIRERLASQPRAERAGSLEQYRSMLAQNPGMERQDTSSRPMDQVVKALGVSVASNAPDPVRVRSDGIGRWRLISTQCRNYIERAREQGKVGASLICAERGEYSPACIQARRKARAVAGRSPAPGKPKDPKTGTVPNKNFSTF